MLRFIAAAHIEDFGEMQGNILKMKYSDSVNLLELSPSKELQPQILITDIPHDWSNTAVRNSQY